LSSATFSSIYWPIETTVRELDACLLLSAVATQRGWSVVIGGKTDLFRRLRQDAEPGIVIDKSIQKRSEHLFSAFKKRGHRVFARCEEGLKFLTAEDYCNRKTGKEAFRAVDTVLAWGREHASALAHVYPEFSQKVVTTGNVRFDLMKPAVRGIYERDVSRFRETWGDFYLLNTKFPKINYIKRGPGFVEGHIAKGHAPTEEQIRLTTRGVALEEALLPLVVDFIERFSKELPGETLVIRPHPGEDTSLWEGIAAGKANVHIVLEGSIHPWLLASKLSIASDCTTSVEAFLLDRPGVNFRPIKDDDVEWVLPKVLAYQIESTDALLEVLALSDPRSALSLPDAPRSEIVGRHVAQCGGTLASEAILDYVADLYRPRQAGTGAGYNPLGKPNLAFTALQRLKVFIAWCISKDNRARHRNRAHKFPGLELSEITARLDHICKTLGYEGVRTTKLAKNIFLIERNT